MFSVADRVCLFSNGFNLELDKNGPLGMLCPKLIDKPNFKTEGRTYFELHLNIDDQQYQEVKEKLVGLNAEMLLFTRRLKELEIWCQDDIDGDTNMNESVKYRVCSPNSILPFVVLENSILGDTLYFIRHHRVDRMPTNPKRAGTPEIVLAFPYDSVLREPILKPQNIFAFLPLHLTAFPVPGLTVKTILTIVVSSACGLSNSDQSRRYFGIGTMEYSVKRCYSRCLCRRNFCNAKTQRYLGKLFGVLVLC